MLAQPSPADLVPELCAVADSQGHTGDAVRHERQRR
jgi:hypothetical protein